MTSKTVSAGVFVALCLSPLVSHAQSPARIDGGPWRPELSVEANALPYVEGTLVPGAGLWNAGAVVEYVNSPLVTQTPTGTQRIIRDQLWSTFSAQLGIGTHWGLGVQVPVLLYQSSDDGARPAATAGLGDLRAVLRWSTRAEGGSTDRLSNSRVSQRQTERREGLGFAMNLAVTAPSGDAGSYSGAGAPTAHLYGVFDIRIARVIGAVSLGYRARLDEHWPSQSGDCASAGIPEVSCLYDTPLRDQITYGVAVRQPLEGLLSLVLLAAAPRAASATILSGYYASTYVTLQGAIDARAPFARVSGSPLEMGAGLQRPQGDFTVTAGASWAMNGAPGAPAARVILGLQWAPRFLDEDHDGFRDDPAVDQCIGLPEDFDGFQDNDGCPEDNDNDAVPEEEDRCPFTDEDEDGFQDEDGCPDPDNDNDDVPDVDDACPNEAPGEHADPARRGCPDNDTDRDGVSAGDDVCPEQPAGPHPDPARAGCALPDGDHDGVPDATDRCPTDAAGEGATAAQHGCPDTDHDHDGVADATDRCPEAQETINGVTDDDGCAEDGVVPLARARVRLVRANAQDPGTIELLEAVRFDARDAVTPLSRPVLAQLAVAMRAATRNGTRAFELSVARTRPAVVGPLAIDAARANRRRDAVLAILRELGAGEQVVRAGEAAEPPGLRAIDRGVVLTLRVTE